MIQGQAKPLSSIAHDLVVLASFLVCGSISGLLFALLISQSSLQSFFFLKGDKFLIPRYSYWFTFSLVQLFGLVGAYLVCLSRHWVVQPISRVRLLSAALIIGFATPVLRLLTPLMNSRTGLDWDLFAAPIAFLVVLSFALCIFSGSLRLLPIAALWNLLFLAAGFGFVYVGVRMIGSSDIYEFVQWPLLEAMLGLSFGSWLIWRQRVNSDRAAEQALGADSPVSSLYS
jgi:hypothetical protein